MIRIIPPRIPHTYHTHSFHQGKKEHLNEIRAKRLADLVNPLFGCLILSMIKEFYQKISESLLSDQAHLEGVKGIFDNDKTLNSVERKIIKRRLKREQ